MYELNYEPLWGFLDKLNFLQKIQKLIFMKFLTTFLLVRKKQEKKQKKKIKNFVRNFDQGISWKPKDHI
jgi:hypothetical protein